MLKDKNKFCRFLPRSTFCLLNFLTILLFGFNTQAFAQSRVIVSSNNINEFKQIGALPSLFCYRGTLASLGILTPSTLRIKSIWNKVDKARLQRILSQLRAQLRRSKGAAKNSIKKSITKTINAIANFPTYQNQCKNLLVTPTPTQTPFPGGEFVGNSQSISPYREQISSTETQHLLNRVAFGGTTQLRNIGINQGLSALVDALVDGTGVVDSNYEATLKSQTKFWSDKFIFHPTEHPDLNVWTTEAAQIGESYRMLYSEQPFKEWMVQFLAAHFSVNFNRINASYSWDQHFSILDHWNLLIDQSLGNFKTIAAAMVSDRAMSSWLNNDDNHADSPNQNFPREFMELFTLGSVDPITHIKNYDEETVKGATAFFSGYYSDWVSGIQSNIDTRVILYSSDLHDTTSHEVFSMIPAAHVNQTMSPIGYVNFLFSNHPSASRYITEKLFAFMAHPDSNEEIVSQLSALLVNSNFELKPVLKMILKSQAMFSPAARTSCMSTPVEEVFKLARLLDFPKLPNTGTQEQMDGYQWMLSNFNDRARSAGQSLFEPPSVFAWKGTCGLNRGGRKAYGEGWIGLQKIMGRQNSCITLMNDLISLDYRFNNLVSSTTLTPEQLIRQINQNFFKVSLTSSQIDILKSFLSSEVENGSIVAGNYDLTDEWFVRRKLPRLFCFLHELSGANIR